MNNDVLKFRPEGRNHRLIIQYIPNTIATVKEVNN